MTDRFDYDDGLAELTPAEALDVLMGAALAEVLPRCPDCGTTGHGPAPGDCPRTEWIAP